MDDKTESQILVSELRDLVHELVMSNFSQLEQDGRAGRLSADDLQATISRYGRTLIDLPEEAFSDDRFSIYQTRGKSKWSIDLTLWTKEEGESDLTLQVEARIDKGDVLLEIDDLHVL